MSNFELRVGGTAYAGWTSLRLTRSMEQFAHSFSVDLTDRWADEGEDVPIEVGSSYTINVDGEQLSTGFIDSTALSYDANNRSLNIAGRSKTADLIDCSAIYAKGQWRKKGLLQIAKDLCDPFSISVEANVSLGGSFENPNFTIEDGETVYQCLDRAARMRGVLLLTNSEGKVIFDRVGSTKVSTVLERGVNILRGRKEHNWEERFSTYILKTQIAGNNNVSGRNSAAITRTADDSFVSGYRPLIILADNESNRTELQNRANWERNVRAGRSRKYTYTVQGWQHTTGLWEPNRLVRVKDTDAHLNEELLIVTVNFERNARGTTTTLELMPKEAFTVGTTVPT